MRSLSVTSEGRTVAIKKLGKNDLQLTPRVRTEVMQVR